MTSARTVSRLMIQLMEGLLLVALIASAASAAVAEPAAAELKITCELLRQPPVQRQITLDKQLVATAVAWPAGHVTLKHVIGLLGESGNTTQLASDLLAEQSADVSAFSGDYWQGVIETCRIFDLVIEQGLTIGVSEEPRNMTDHGAVGGIPSITQGGPLVLARRPVNAQKPIYLSCGMVLGEVATFDIREHHGAGSEENSMDVLIKTRFEPHVQSNLFGRAHLVWSEATDENDKKLKVTSSEAGGENPGGEMPIHFTAVPEHLASLRLTGELLVEQLEAFEVSASLHVGDIARGKLNDMDLEMHVLGDKESANFNGGRTSSVNVSFPEAMLWAYPTLKISTATGSDPCGLNGWHSDDQHVNLTYVCRKLDANAYRFLCSGHAIIREAHLPMKCLLRTEVLPKTEMDPSSSWALQAPTQVSWTAAHRTIKESLRLLAVHDNSILLELGEDEQHAVAVPAFSGNFWDGVVAICRAYGLTMIAPAPLRDDSDVPRVDERGQVQVLPAFLAGGPLILGAPSSGRCALDAFQPCGPLLVIVEHVALNTEQGLNGISRKGEISYRLRMEPRFDVNLIESATIDWATFAGESDGHQLMVEPPAPDASADQALSNGRFHMRIVRKGNVFFQIPQAIADDGQGAAPINATVTINGLPAGNTAIDLPGQVNVSLSRDVRCAIKLVVGANGVAHLDGHALDIHLFANGENGDIPGRAGITIDQGYDSTETLNVRVVSASGEALRVNNGFPEMMNSQQKMTKYFTGIKQGEYTVSISTKRQLVKFCLPIRISTTTP